MFSAWATASASSRALSQLKREAGELLRVRVPAQPMGDQAAVGLDAGGLAAKAQRLGEMPLGELGIAAPVVHAAQLVLDRGQPRRIGERRRRLVRRNGRAVLAAQRVQVADRLVQVAALLVAEGDRRPVGVERLAGRMQRPCPVARGP